MGEDDAVDGRAADIWSLGITLFAMLGKFDYIDANILCWLYPSSLLWCSVGSGARFSHLYGACSMVARQGDAVKICIVHTFPTLCIRYLTTITKLFATWTPQL